MKWKHLFSPCPSLFFFIARSLMTELSDFEDRTLKASSLPVRKGRQRQGELGQFPIWQLNVFHHLFFWWMGTFLNLSSPFHLGEMCFEYVFDIKVHKRWLSKVHDYPLKCTNVLLKKRNPKWELYVHAYSWNPANFWIFPHAVNMLTFSPLFYSS